MALDLNNTIRGVNTQMVIYVYCISHSFAQLICFQTTGVSFTYPRQAVFFVLNCTTDVLINTVFVDHFLVGVRALPYGFLALFDPVSFTSGW